VPASYGTVAYHGLHAFRWVAADGSARFVRYHLLPAAGEEFLSPQVARTKGANFLIEELDERLASQSVRFDYQIQIAADGDSTVDPSRPWHSTKTVSVGSLDITASTQNASMAATSSYSTLCASPTASNPPTTQYCGSVRSLTPRR